MLDSIVDTEDSSVDVLSLMLDSIVDTEDSSVDVLSLMLDSIVDTEDSSVDVLSLILSSIVNTEVSNVEIILFVELSIFKILSLSLESLVCNSIIIDGLLCKIDANSRNVSIVLGAPSTIKLKLLSIY